MARPLDDFEQARQRFKDLRTAIMDGAYSDLPDDQTMADVRRAWAEYECYNEARSANDFLGQDDLRAAVANYELFPFYQNFLRADVALLAETVQPRAVGDPTPHLLMVGAGPLPLTSMMFGEWEHGQGCRVTNVDNDETALALGKAFMERAAVPNQQFICADGAELIVPEDVDAVIVAALAGEDQAQKIAIISNISAQLRPGARLSFRHGIGNRRLLYPACQLDDALLAQMSMRPAASIQPDQQFFNAIDVLEKY